MISRRMIFVPDDIEVVADVRRRRDESEKAGDERSAADSLEQVPVAQNLGESDQVDAVVGVPEIDQNGVNRLMRRDVEILLVDLFLDHGGDGIAGRDEHRAEHALLRLDAVRQGAVNIR